MSMLQDRRPARAYKIGGEDGRRYVVYNASVIGNPADHEANKWYIRPYSASMLRDEVAGGPFDSAEEAERLARSWREWAAR